MPDTPVMTPPDDSREDDLDCSLLDLLVDRNKPALITSLRVRPGHPHLDGWMTRRCWSCDQPAWVQISTLEMLYPLDSRVVCDVCADAPTMLRALSS